MLQEIGLGTKQHQIEKRIKIFESKLNMKSFYTFFKVNQQYRGTAIFIKPDLLSYITKNEILIEGRAILIKIELEMDIYNIMYMVPQVVPEKSGNF